MPADPHVYPIFYYNTMLAPVGGEVGLNLFEPRYVLMCERMSNGIIPHHYLFVVNTADYTACPGDTAHLIDVQQLGPNLGGRTWSIRGTVRAEVIITAPWNEPGTQGLAHAAIEIPSPPCAQISVEETNMITTLLRSSTLWDLQPAQWQASGQAKTITWCGEGARDEPTCVPPHLLLPRPDLRSSAFCLSCCYQ